MAVIITMVSCTTQKGVLNYLHNNPKLAEEFCSSNYPPIVQEIKGDTVYTKASNQDYSGVIDSLSDQLTYARGLLDMYSKSAPDTCKYLVDVYEKEINSLSGKIKELRDKYKPCEPETRTITRTISVVDSALKLVNTRLEEQLKQEQSKSKNRLYWIIGLSVALLVSGYFNVRKLLPI